MIKRLGMLFRSALGAKAEDISSSKNSDDGRARRCDRAPSAVSWPSQFLHMLRQCANSSDGVKIRACTIVVARPKEVAAASRPHATILNTRRITARATIGTQILKDCTREVNGTFCRKVPGRSCLATTVHPRSYSPDYCEFINGIGPNGVSTVSNMQRSDFVCLSLLFW
jgi:hypothetical protein